MIRRRTFPTTISLYNRYLFWKLFIVLVIMVLPSAMALAAVRSVGRRSSRLMKIHHSAASADSVLSLSATKSDDKSQTPLREANTVVPVTPSPRKQKRKPSTSVGRKRKRSPDAIPDTPVSRKLEIDDKVAISPGSVSGVENKSLELTTDIVAAINPSQEFVDLKVPPAEMRPSKTLTTGQCFHWTVVHPTKKSEEPTASAWGTHDATEWIGTLRLRLFDSNESVVLVVRELPNTTLYRLLATTRDYSKTTEDEEKQELHRAILEYFQLDVGMVDLYEEWSGSCQRLSKIAKCIPGVRIIRQDPWECLVSFICSSNNNIPRITKMLASIRREYGQPLLQIPMAPQENGENDSGEYHQLYTFPSLEELALQATDEDLRSKCGMGYRASYILETMKTLRDAERGGEDYLRTVLRNIKDPIEVQTKLCDFKGVGRKVADCVALFSLDQENAIPVDTHVWNIAIRDYDPEGTLKTNVKSLTPSNYKMVGDLFRSRFPNKAGWAHSLLFVAELPSFRDLLPKELVEEMDTFQKEEKERKRQQKEEKKKTSKK